jgi:hypothetical protein
MRENGLTMRTLTLDDGLGLWLALTILMSAWRNRNRSVQPVLTPKASGGLPDTRAFDRFRPTRNRCFGCD